MNIKEACAALTPEVTDDIGISVLNDGTDMAQLMFFHIAPNGPIHGRVSVPSPGATEDDVRLSLEEMKAIVANL